MTAMLVSVNEATKMIGVGRTTLYALIAEGKIGTKTVGKRRLIKVASLQEFVNTAAVA